MRDWHWRNSMKPVRFFALDARAAIPFALLLVHFRPYTLVLALVVTIAFWLAERMGLTFPAALRRLRIAIIGYRRPRLIWTANRSLIDYGAS